jgi:mycofactocin precursor
VISSAITSEMTSHGLYYCTECNYSARMAQRTASTAPGTAVPKPAPADEVLLEEAGLVEEDLLVEDVSIDGMCGVY